APPAGDITLAIFDQNGQLVRELSSKPQPARTEPPPNVPNYWLARPVPVPRNAGMNRYVWDLRYTAPDAIQHTYSIAALYENTPPEPQGPFVVPGKYEVRLTVNGKTYKQPLTVGLDPRVTMAPGALEQQLELQKKIDALISLSYEFHSRAAALRAKIAEREKAIENNDQAKTTLQAVKEFDGKVGKIQGEERRGFPGFGKPKPTFRLMNSELATLTESVGGADAAPTDAMRTAYHDYCEDLTKLAAQWSDLMKEALPGINGQLTQQQHLEPLATPAPLAAVPACGR